MVPSRACLATSSLVRGGQVVAPVCTTAAAVPEATAAVASPAAAVAAATLFSPSEGSSCACARHPVVGRPGGRRGARGSGRLVAGCPHRPLAISASSGHLECGVRVDQHEAQQHRDGERPIRGVPPAAPPAAEQAHTAPPGLEAEPGPCLATASVVKYAACARQRHARAQTRTIELWTRCCVVGALFHCERAGPSFPAGDDSAALYPEAPCVDSTFDTRVLALHVAFIHDPF